MPPDSDKVRIGHMIEAATEAVEHARGVTLEELSLNRPLQHLLVRDIEILGEAASRVGTELREAHPGIPWRTMTDMRNRLIHAYFDIDLEIVLTTVDRMLPGLIAQLRAIWDSLEDDT